MGKRQLARPVVMPNAMSVLIPNLDAQEDVVNRRIPDLDLLLRNQPYPNHLRASRVQFRPASKIVG
jgi:hypothetical protein